MRDSSSVFTFYKTGTETKGIIKEYSDHNNEEVEGKNLQRREVGRLQPTTADFRQMQKITTMSVCRLPTFRLCSTWLWSVV